MNIDIWVIWYYDSIMYWWIDDEDIMTLILLLMVYDDEIFEGGWLLMIYSINGVKRYKYYYIRIIEWLEMINAMIIPGSNTVEATMNYGEIIIVQEK